MMRQSFGNNIKSLCNAKRLNFNRDYDHVYISTDYETFCFELDDQDMWLSWIELKGAGKEGRTKVNKFLTNPKPGKVIETVLSNISVRNEAEFVAKHFERVKKKCEKYGMRCEMKFHAIFIYTIAEEFYIEFDVDDTRKVKMRHRGDNVWSKISDEYHRQFEREITPCEVVDYIYKHTRNKYGIKSCEKSTQVK